MIRFVKELNINLAGVEIASPLIGAAGTIGNLDELGHVSDFSGLGAITTKSITSKSREGHPPWRLIDTKLGMINAIGLANPGVDKFVDFYGPRISNLPVKVIGSIAGNSIDSYLQVAEAFENIDDMPIVEVNISCPNTKDGRSFVSDHVLLSELIREIKKVLLKTKLSVKLPPDAQNLVGLTKNVIESGADMLVVSNTFPAMSIDPITKKSRLSARYGGLSGPGTHPIVVRLVNVLYKEITRSSGTPIIALGGVLDWEDAAEFFVAGASAVGLGTALMADPFCPKKILKGLKKWVRYHGVESIKELTGSLID